MSYTGPLSVDGTPGRGNFCGIGTRTDYRGRGIGKLVFCEMCHRHAAAGADFMSLYTGKTIRHAISTRRQASGLPVPLRICGRRCGMTGGRTGIDNRRLARHRGAPAWNGSRRRATGSPSLYRSRGGGCGGGRGCDGALAVRADVSDPICVREAFAQVQAVLGDPRYWSTARASRTSDFCRT